MNLFLVAILAIIQSSLASAAEEGKYCLAIRGNGESLGAHDNPIARAVETMGMPKAMTGGSSASITMFFVDSVAGNKKVLSEKDIVLQRKMQAFLIRSIPDFMKGMVKNANIPGLIELGKEVSAKEGMMQKFMEAMKGLKRLNDDGTAKKVFGTYLGMINPEILKGLASADSKIRSHYYKMALDSAKMLGAFDATDPMLFFRPGLIDFKHAGLVMGLIGDFYAGNMPESLQNELLEIAKSCADDSSKRAKAGDCTLKKIGDPESNDGFGCNTRFESLVQKFLGDKTIKQFAEEGSLKRVFEPIGTNVPSFVSTSVIAKSKNQVPGVEDSFTKYERIKKAVLAGPLTDATLEEIKKFSVDPKDVSCKYFGNRNGEISNLNAKLQSDGFTDPKSAMTSEFDSPGKVKNWLCILALSPAEPGLANFQQIPKECARDSIGNKIGVIDQDQQYFYHRWDKMAMEPNMLSGGGWCDLQPNPVLEAAGCGEKNNAPIVYDTRQNGETQFGQKVNIRLLGEANPESPNYVPFWKEIGAKLKTEKEIAAMATEEEKTAARKIQSDVLKSFPNFAGKSVQEMKDLLKSYNNNGSWPSIPKDSLWARNWLKRAGTSSEESIRKADIVFCTDWDNYDVFAGQQDEMVAQACNAKVFAKAWVPEGVRKALGAEVPKDPSFFHPGCVAKSLPGNETPGFKPAVLDGVAPAKVKSTFNPDEATTTNLE